MILYFKNGHGQLRRIGKIDGRMSAEKITAEIDRQIKAFCDEKHFKIYYTRIWDEDWKGRPMTKFDVGSHCEFFYTSPPSSHLYRKVNEERKKKEEAEREKFAA